MTKEQSIKRATNRVLKNHDLIIVIDNKDLSNDKNSWTTRNADKCIPDLILVSTVVVHKSNLNDYYIKQKQEIQNGRFKDTIIIIE